MNWRFVSGVGLAFGLVAGACSTDETTNSPGGGDTGCGEDPWACGAGETCWPVSSAGHLECIDAPTDQIEGAPCEFIVGQAQCAPHLYCFPNAQQSSSGVCSPFCNQGVCLNGGTCVMVTLVGSTETVQVCTPNAGDSGTGGTAGTDGGLGGTGGIAGSGGTGGIAGSGGSGGIAGSGGTVTGGTGGVAGSAGNGGTGGQGGTAGTSAGGSAGTSSGGSAGTSSGGNAGTSAGGASGAAGATP